MTARRLRIVIGLTALGLTSSAIAQSSDQALRAAHATCNGVLREAVASGAAKSRQRLKPYVVQYHKCMSSALAKSKGA